jgi:hypothetical protein
MRRFLEKDRQRQRGVGQRKQRKGHSDGGRLGQRVLQIEERAAARVRHHTRRGRHAMWEQGWGGRAGTNGLRSEMTSAHLRARHTPPASSEMAGVLGCSFLLTSDRRRAVMREARRDYGCDTVRCRRARPAATRLRGL